jgi:hypothetical protein
MLIVNFNHSGIKEHLCLFEFELVQAMCAFPLKERNMVNHNLARWCMILTNQVDITILHGHAISIDHHTDSRIYLTGNML